MLIPFELNAIKWRYLDSLDSVRFSKTYLVIRKADKPIRVRHASIEVSATILMGNGVIVPINQLIDSFGFLRIASEIIKAAETYKSKGKNIFIPIKYAFYDYNHERNLGAGPHLIDPFLLTAYLFEKDGLDERGYFELSAWPELNRDQIISIRSKPNNLSRRREWAKELRNHCMAIPNRLILSNDFYEEMLAEDLIRVLYYFNVNRHLIISTGSVKGVREEMVRFVSNLSEENITKNKYFSNKFGTTKTRSVENKLIKILDIAKVFKKLEDKENNGKKIIDNRSYIVEELTNKEIDYFTCDSILLGLYRVGVLETVDSIYNYSGYKSTHANQDNQSEPMNNDAQWGYDEAAFALGQWVREKYASIHGVSSDDISSTQDAYINPLIIDPSYVVNNINEFWKNFFEFQQSDDWNESIIHYQNQLKIFEETRQQYHILSANEKTRLKKAALSDEANKYEDARNYHIRIVNKFLDKYKYQIEVDDNKKAILVHRINGKIESKIQIEDFAEYALLSREEKGSLYSSKTAKDISIKSLTSEYDS